MCTVLVIDDEETIVELLKSALTKFGYHVKTAADGREGIQTFENEFVDIVITDICMPDIGGKEVARHIRNSRRKTTPVVAISGTPWLFEDGDFDMVLAKPFHLKALYETVEYLAGNSPAMATAR